MPRSNVKIQTQGIGRAVIEIDGKSLESMVTGYEFRQHGREVPELKLDIVPDSVLIKGAAGVQVNPEMRDLLIALGWTPPSS